MKRFLKIFVVLLALGALTQTVVSAKVKDGDTTDSAKAGSTGPGI